MAKRKSETAVTKTVENSIYDIVSQYNGIVDKLLDATQSNGRYETKRMTSQSSISYLANVLKGLLEPAKHLMNELALVRDPGTSTLFNMMKNMVKVIDDCPPFQKIDVRVYRNGKPNYEAFNKELPIEDFDGTIANLEAARDELRVAQKQLYKDTTYINATLKGEDAQYKKAVFANIKEKEKGIKEALAQANADIKAVKQRKLEGKTYPNEKYNAAKGLIASTKAVSEAAVAAAPLASASGTETSDVIVELLSNTKTNLASINTQLDGLLERVDKEDRTFDEEEAAIVETLEATAHQIMDAYNSLDSKIITDEDPAIIAKLQRKIERHKVLIKALLARFTKINEEEIQKEQAEAQAEAGGDEGAAPAGGAEAVGEGEGIRKYRHKDDVRRGIGMGKPLADLLGSKMKVQYNSMGRPLTDDNDAHKEMKKLEQKWQDNIPIHYSKIGDKNPFYSQTEDTKYFFPQKLRYENNLRHPQQNALGADVSLLQGEVGGPTQYVPQKKPTKKPEITERTPQEALQNILNQDIYKDGMTGGYCGAGKNEAKSGALRKLVFDDENNDAFDEEELPRNRGFIKEDKEDFFKLPNLKKAKQKAFARRM
jgi:hypothetical protein